MAKLLCVGDIHLGYRQAVTASERGSADSSIASAWDRTVEQAITRNVDAVLLAGDVVENDEALPEALYPLEKGIRELVAAGIPVIAVAGNHDTRALPHIARLVPEMKLLGSDGAWEVTRVESSTGPAVRILGRSFVVAQNSGNPLDDLDEATRADLETGDPVIGLLHCDLGVAASRYAPVSQADLDRVPVVAWLLGHIHAPSVGVPARKPIGYLGSLQGLDPTETGLHGPWIVEVKPGGSVTLEQFSVAGLEWTRAEVDVTGCADAISLRAQVLDSLPSIADRTTAPLVGVRVNLVGRMSDLRPLVEAFGAYDAHDAALSRQVEGQRVFVDAVRWDRVLPERDLATIAAEADAGGVIAKLLLELESGTDLSPRSAALLKEMTQLVDRQWRRAQLPAMGDPRQMVIELLREAGLDILDRIPATGGRQ